MSRGFSNSYLALPCCGNAGWHSGAHAEALVRALIAGSFVCRQETMWRKLKRLRPLIQPRRQFL